ncbi:MAG TPA: hypothetical protein K8V85_08435 [Staphylococcus kloosii]|jgi:uncharacterized membrane protein|uniref:Uncharacterized protein n=1 Tax=Staphylococcus kloosii TaxID=29384 RepID=A0A921GYX7_9STAP|nr:hypothetical protein [Staphylococcus kloosii]MCD8879605.1 hypothetical protein [Staphylococcus kloosii]HJF68324.1 hypothetical protein [Staphylococcus kloosii]
MSALVLIIVGLLLGLYFHRRKAPMTVKDWFLGLAVILVCIIIVSGFQNVDAIVQGFKDGAESGK